MLIHALTNNERTMYSLDTGGALTNFNEHRFNEKMGCIELFNHSMYVGMVRRAKVQQFSKAFQKCLKARA